MSLIGQKAKKAFANKLDTKKKNKVLKKYLSLIEKEKNSIFFENKKDIKFAINKKLESNLVARLMLDSKKLNSIKQTIKNIINLKDPVDNVLESWKRPNKLLTKKFLSLLG